MDLASQIEWEPVVRILLAVILGGIIGIEREFSGRAAGLRTHILVCVGSTLIVLASAAVPRIFGDSYLETLRIDPGRIAAGIVTGIGFLGAGAIIRTAHGDYVRGLTTAACIWFAAALGIVIGEGFYFLAIVGTIVVFCVLRFDVFFESRIKSPIYRTLAVRIEASRQKDFEEKCRKILNLEEIYIQDIDCGFQREGYLMEIKIYLKTHRAMQSGNIVNLLKDEPGVVSIRWEN